MLRDLLCAFGIFCAPVQPDVSGFTILNLLIQTNAREDLMLPALGSLYEDVDVVASDPDGESIIVYLGRDGRRMAWLSCETRRGAELDEERATYQEQPTLWAEVGRARPAPGFTGRADCSFFYEDGVPETRAFQDQIEMWARSEIGMRPEHETEIFQPDDFATKPGSARGMALNPFFSAGRHAKFRLMFDVP